MKKFSAAFALCSLLLFADLAIGDHFQLVGDVPVGGGAITITNFSSQTIATNGLDVASAGGFLTYVSAAPYTFPLSQTPNLVTLAVIPGSVDYAPGQSRVLGVDYNGPCLGDLIAQYGCLCFVPPPAFRPICIPEPSSMALSAIGVLAVTSFVRVGRNKAIPA